MTKTLLHGSSNELPVGTVLTPQPGYGARWGEMLSYMVLEMFRPKDALAHDQAVFMVDNLNDIDNAGASTDYIYAVQPMGKVSQHDLNHHSMIESAFDSREFRDVNPSFLEQTLAQNPGAKQILQNLALSYWMGDENEWGEDPVWEYLAPKAKIIKSLGGDAYELDEIRRRAGIPVQ